MSQPSTGPARERTGATLIIPSGIIFVGVTLLLAVLVSALPGGVSLAGSAPSKTSTPDDTCGQVVPSSNRGTSNGSLYSVAAVSANDVWAVGYNANAVGVGTVIEHWNGTAWSIVPSPVADYNYLSAVTAVSANDVWAVGYNGHGGPEDTLVEHWNGARWSVVPSPSPGPDGNSLNGVAAVSANDVWAVGYYASVAGMQTLIEHWNGTAWSVVPSPGPGPGISGILNGVAAVSANDVWAVGTSSVQTLVEHWNGTAWSVVPSPSPGTESSYLLGATAVSASDVWAVGYFRSGVGGSKRKTLVEHWNGTQWTVVPSPGPGTNANFLNGVAAVSASDVWAAGYYYNGSADQTLLEHWNGTAWSVVPSPSPGTYPSYLSAVAAVSANNLWAVGRYYFAGAYPNQQTLVERWDGTQWSVVTSPNPQGTERNSLSAVAAVSSTDMWAVGRYYNDIAGTYQTLVEHWNSRAWMVVPSPNPGTGSSLDGVVAVAANDVWAVGSYGLYPDQQTLIEHWNGTAWSVVPSPSPGIYPNFLNGVAVVSASDVWAVGDYSNTRGGPEETLVEHWNGTAWSVAPSPNQDFDNSLFGVAAVSANDVWAVGSYGPSIYVGSTSRTLVEHWNGSAWAVIPSPSPGTTYNFLYGVFAASTNDVWAVGDYYSDIAGTYQTLVEHWNGTAWTVVPSPNQGTGANYLYGVASVMANDVWAVGYYLSDGTSQTLVEHWNGTAWSVVPSPNRGASNNELFGIAVVTVNDVWAVGDNYIGTTQVPQTLVEHYAAGYSDVLPGSTFYPYVTCLSTRDIISGYSDCTFRPNKKVTRGQLAKLLANAAGYVDTIPSTRQTFADVPPSNAFWLYVERVSLHGVVNGYSGNGTNINPCTGSVEAVGSEYFRWCNTATRGQLTKIVSNAAGLQDSIPTSVQTFTDVPYASAFWVYVERLMLNRPGVMGGYPCGGANEPCDPQRRPYFRPGNNVTRGQTSKIVANTFFPDCQTPRDIKH